ncbi:Homoserine O-succinyltransferase [Baekduia alba]|uniref:homoserine O-acetyltransferase MetX n=1 Tax=Baekduia alba TaxID=2997333 RepID=UPI002340B93A|nr:homoserine O-acetyltransferase [Baekduia alba]WCB92162.1 Homoserine O-succinyltransferase [Baekduia alba]
MASTAIERAGQRVVLYGEDDPLALACGRTLAPVEVAYATYGTLNADRSNAVFVCHALTGDADASGAGGWWSTMVGPGRPIDTDALFVICPNLLGGCRGTTGPSSVDPGTGKAYGLDFPPLAIADLVTVHRRLLSHLGIARLHAAIGGSMGGMQVLQWLIDAPGEVQRAVLVGASPRLTAQNIALSHVARRAILDDPDFRDGDYAAAGVRPARGLATARRLANVTYLSEDGMAQKFARAEPDGWAGVGDAARWLAPAYDVESYLEHQAETFLARFDALSYLYLTRIMDAFDPFGGPSAPALDPATRALVVSFTSDWRFGTEHSRALAAGLRRGGIDQVDEQVIASPWGHDSFLLDVPEYLDRVRAFVNDR